MVIRIVREVQSTNKVKMYFTRRGRSSKSHTAMYSSLNLKSYVYTAIHIA